LPARQLCHGSTSPRIEGAGDATGLTTELPTHTKHRWMARCQLQLLTTGLLGCWGRRLLLATCWLEGVGGKTNLLLPLLTAGLNGLAAPLVLCSRRYCLRALRESLARLVGRSGGAFHLASAIVPPHGQSGARTPALVVSVGLVLPARRPAP